MPSPDEEAVYALIDSRPSKCLSLRYIAETTELSDERLKATLNRLVTAKRLKQSTVIECPECGSTVAIYRNTQTGDYHPEYLGSEFDCIDMSHPDPGLTFVAERRHLRAYFFVPRP